MKVFVTGGSGFLGKQLVPMLKRNYDVWAPKHSDCDLRFYTDIADAIWNFKPDVVIHAAADVGGIGYNSTHAAQLIDNNLSMGINVLNACKANQTPKVIMVGSVCAYPSPLPRVPAFEEDLWRGRPEESNAAYGIAKRTLIEMGIAYARAGYLKCVNLLLANLYGPGDSFDLERCHVVPALVKKFVDASRQGKREVSLWGDGEATRDLLYVTDAAEAIEAALTHDLGPEPINIATGKEVSIKSLAGRLRCMIDDTLLIHWDTTKPAGQPRRAFTTGRAQYWLDWSCRTSLGDGLGKTITYYNHLPNFPGRSELV